MLAPIHDNNCEIGLWREKRSLVRGAADTYDEFIPTCLCKPFLASNLQQFDSGKKPLGMRRVYVEIISLDFPKRARCKHQRIEVLAVDEYVQAGEIVASNLVGALVMRIVSCARTSLGEEDAM
jgi:hypothetical protein